MNILRVTLTSRLLNEMPQVIMTATKMPPRHLLLVFCILLAPRFIGEANAQSFNDKLQPHLETLWENAAPSNMPLPLTLVGLTQSSNGSAVLLLSDQQNNKSLFIGANESGPGHLTPLPTLTTVAGSGLRLVTGAAGQIWIGGISNYREALFGGHISDAYLAKLDSNGRLAWERNFEDPNGKEIHDLAALPDGDVVVVGTADNKAWIARISSDGHVVWERTISLGYAATVAIIGDKIVVAGFDADDEAIWRFNSNGEPINHQVIEETIGKHPGPLLFIKLFAGESNGAIYIFSLWSEAFNPHESMSAHPLKVIKLNSQGQIIWRNELSQVVLQGLKVTELGPDHRSTFCMPIIGLLGNRDLLVACPGTSLLLISKLDSTTGELKQVAVQRPLSSLCQEYRSWPKVIVPRSDKAIWLLGAGRCTWLDQISLMQ
jgi:hypothetical protein